MKSDMKSLLRTIVLLGGAAIASHAATFLTLTPSGSVSGLPGSTVGWGFSLVNTTNFLVVTSANFCLNPLNPPACTTASPSVGVFHDFISTQPNAVIVGPAPESTTVAQTFNSYITSETLATRLATEPLDGVAPRHVNVEGHEVELYVRTT